MTGTNDSSIASLADATERGDRSAADALFAALYSELHRLARRELARQGVPLGLSATTLLHQAYLDMAEREGPAFPDRARFMGYAARVMRGLIIDHARNRQAQKRGGLFEITSLTTDVLENPVDYLELERIGEALDQLGKTGAFFSRGRGLEVFLRFLLFRDRCYARRLGADGAAQLGEGPDLSAPQPSRGYVDEYLTPSI